ncbi:hypothetical protein GJ496_008601 [Pomphorhynchus laevis]|nr:hypothetical protein GJ496_008601 [Pomphorhynchus laevis]
MNDNEVSNIHYSVNDQTLEPMNRQICGGPTDISMSRKIKSRRDRRKRRRNRRSTVSSCSTCSSQFSTSTSSSFSSLMSSSSYDSSTDSGSSRRDSRKHKHHNIKRHRSKHRKHRKHRHGHRHHRHHVKKPILHQVIPNIPLELNQQHQSLSGHHTNLPLQHLLALSSGHHSTGLPTASGCSRSHMTTAGYPLQQSYSSAVAAAALLSNQLSLFNNSNISTNPVLSHQSHIPPSPLLRDLLPTTYNNSPLIEERRADNGMDIAPQDGRHYISGKQQLSFKTNRRKSDNIFINDFDKKHSRDRNRRQRSITSVILRGDCPLFHENNESRLNMLRRDRQRHEDQRQHSLPFDRQANCSHESAYPGLPKPPDSYSFGSTATFRHLPTKELCETDFIQTLPRKYFSARNVNADEVWRLKMKKIQHNIWPNVSGKLIDCHCHLDFLFIKISFYGCIDDYFKLFSEAFFPNFDSLITVFCNPISLMPDQFRIWSRILNSSKVYASCGIHPHASHYYTDEVKHNLLAALKHPKVKAVGECGIDRSHKNQIHVDIQARALKSQLKLAIQTNKPVVLHARDAYVETLEVAKQVLPSDYRIHLHCYTDTWTTAKEWMSNFSNVMFGFTPLLSFSSHKDSPYFVPRELYQDTNLCHPGFVYSVAETISRIKTIKLDEVVHQTEQNARQFYNL